MGGGVGASCFQLDNRKVKSHLPCEDSSAVEAVAMGVNFFRAGVPAKEVALGER